MANLENINPHINPYNGGTFIRQTWEIANGAILLAIKTSKPLDSPTYESLQTLVDAMETFVYANQRVLKPEEA